MNITILSNDYLFEKDGFQVLENISEYKNIPASIKLNYQDGLSCEVTFPHCPKEIVQAVESGCHLTLEDESYQLKLNCYRLKTKTIAPSASNPAITEYNCSIFSREVSECWI